VWRVIDPGPIFAIERSKSQISPSHPRKQDGRIEPSTRLQKPRLGCGAPALVQPSTESRPDLLHRPASHLRTERSTSQTTLRISGAERWRQDSSSESSTLGSRTQLVRSDFVQMEEKPTIDLAIAVAKKTGDYSVLSHADICVVALTYELDLQEKEKSEDSQVALVDVFLKRLR
jgi:hypothetical protein